MRDVEDVTERTEFGNNDGESAPLFKCVCGKKYEGWDFVLSAYAEEADACGSCGRKLFFKNKITIYEILGD